MAMPPGPPVEPRDNLAVHEDPEQDPRARNPHWSPEYRPADPRQSGDMSFLQHLDELRAMLVHVVIATLVGAIGGWMLAPYVLEDLIHRTTGTAVLLTPLEPMNERIKLTLLLGMLLAGPYVFYRIWQFVVPGLLKKERSLVLPMSLASMVLFAIGVAVSYVYVVPLIVSVLATFKTPSMIVQVRLSELLGFFYNVSLACGVIMQLPLVTMTLTAIGLVTPGFLIRQWRYAVVGGFVLTAAITPGDVITAQLVLGGPMVLLYFISVGLSYLVAKRRRPSADPEEVASADQA
jgi:sec-independent protein translocase protein TatC